MSTIENIPSSVDQSTGSSSSAVIASEGLELGLGLHNGGSELLGLVDGGVGAAAVTPPEVLELDDGAIGAAAVAAAEALELELELELELDDGGVGAAAVTAAEALELELELELNEGAGVFFPYTSSAAVILRTGAGTAATTLNLGSLACTAATCGRAHERSPCAIS
jgi:hypothetical protein